MWFVQPFDDTIDRKIKKFKSDKQLIKNYKTFIEELKIAGDPRTLGGSQTWKIPPLLWNTPDQVSQFNLLCRFSTKYSLFDRPR